MSAPAPGTALPDGLRLPRYGHSTLADLLPGVLSHLDPGSGAQDVLGLPSAGRYVVLLVDGLGHRLLRGALAHTEYFAEVFGDAVEITSGVPSTTATSLTCLGVGTPPGVHGMAGYAFRSPGTGRPMNALTWEGGPEDPTSFQPLPTVFERAAAAGVAVSSVGPARFEGSGMTTASLRGPVFEAVDEADDSARIDRAVAASRRGGRSLVYVYERSLDHAGHGKGCGSQAWLDALERIDAFAGRLREALDDDTCLLVTGDHGMVDVPSSHHVVYEDHPSLRSGVDLLSGEGRMRQLWTGQPEKVAQRWQQVLAERALVRTREQAEAEGWFGPLGQRTREHFGDVLVAMLDDWAVMTRSLPREMHLVGQHGSLTEAEMVVPLLVDHPASW